MATDVRDDPSANWTRWRRQVRENKHVPRALFWATRAFGFIWIGLVTFASELHTHDMRTLTIQIVGYVVIGAAMLVWGLMDARVPEGTTPGRWLPLSLAVVSGVSGVICMSHNGALLVLFACIAALVAGGDTTLGPAVAVVSVGILGVMVGAIVFGANAAELIGYPVTILSALLMGRHRRTYRVQAEQAAELLARTKELQVQQRRADVLDERTRIAREIHEVLAHSLGGLAIQIQAARAVLTDSGDIETALEVLATAQRMASDGLAETRRAVHALRSDTLSLDQELRNLGGTHASRHHASVEVSVEGTPRDLPTAATIALLRVAQEAMVNAAKHAPRQPVELCLDYTPRDVRLTAVNAMVRGNVVGDSELRTADSGYGLTGMKERLLLIGGTLDVGRRGDTWTVTAELRHAQIAGQVETARDGQHVDTED